MDRAAFDRVARELLDLLDQQVAAIVGRDFNDLSKEELEAYRARKGRILELRSVLTKLLAA